MTSIRSLTAVIAAAAAVTAGAARAEGLATDRVLNGHAFLPSFVIRTPFAATSFDANLGYGVGSASGPTYNLAGNIDGSRTYSFAAMGQTFGYEKLITEGVSAGGGVQTTLYSGIDGPSALVVGADVNVGLLGKVTAGHRFGPIQAAATLDLAYGPRLGIIVIDAVRSAIASGGVETDPALAIDKVLTLQPGFAASWAPHKALGITAAVDWQWVSADKEQGSSDGSAAGLGFAGDLDFGKITSVPLGLLAAIHWVEPLAGQDISRVQDYSLGGFYTGKPELVLGAEVAWREFHIRPDLKSSATLLQVRAAYLW